jgi:ectoine hydroxylase-related dioxygenase (phytanoyl-CoA dioxygenase family)
MSDISQFFKQNGYYHAKGVFSPSEVAELERDFDRLVAQLMSSDEHINARWKGPEVEKLGAQNTVVYHTHNVQQFSAAWHRATLQPRFLDVVEAIIGPDIVLHHTKLFQKPAENGAPFPMHQDWAYFPTEQDSMMAGVIHVSDATDEMGCLRVYPGSHKLGRLQGSWGQSASDILLNDYPIEKSTPVECQAGDVVFFSYFTVHGSMPNRSDKVRKTVLVQLHAGDDQVEEGNMHPDENVVLRGWNSHMTRNKAGRAKMPLQ